MKILFIDIETSPAVVYTWNLNKTFISTDQVIASKQIICFAAKWYGDNNIMYHSHWKDGESMYKHLHSLLDEADVLVHYNGKRFDVPMINKAFLEHEMAPPSTYHQIDLYQVMRSRFRFDSNKLEYIVKELGLGKKIEHAGFSLWKGWIAGDSKSIDLMEKYNKMDVKLTEKLYERCLGWIKGHPNMGLYLEEDRPVCTNCGSAHVTKRGIETTSTMTYQRYKCEKCGNNMRGRKNIGKAPELTGSSK